MLNHKISVVNFNALLYSDCEENKGIIVALGLFNENDTTSYEVCFCFPVCFPVFQYT